MKHHARKNRPFLWVRVAAFLTAVMLVLSAASCRSGNTDKESSLKEISVEELDTSLTDFLTRFTDWYNVEDSDKVFYDSRKAWDGQTNVLRWVIANGPCVDWSLYPFDQPQEVYDQQNPDPKNWAQQFGGSYMIFDGEGADWITTHIFNAAETDIASMRQQGEEKQWFYFDDGRYYVPIGGVGDPLTEYTFTAAKSDGTVFSVEYRSDFYNGDISEYHASYRAEAERRTIDGKDYWTLIQMEQLSDEK